MTIRERVDDAAFLAQSGRYIGALTMILIAVAASSRRTFLKGSKSHERPAEEMSDREAFTLFLSGRIRKLLFGDYGGPDAAASVISVQFRGRQIDVASVLYKYYRCVLVHGGELPEYVEFSASQSPLVHADNGRKALSVSIQTGDKLVLDHGWLDLLIEVVARARCNGTEFGIRHFELVTRPGVDEAAVNSAFKEKFGTTDGRVSILKQAVRNLSPSKIAQATDAGLVDLFRGLVEAHVVNGGAITGLRFHGFTDENGVLQRRGIDALRELSTNYQLTAL